MLHTSIKTVLHLVNWVNETSGEGSIWLPIIHSAFDCAVSTTFRKFVSFLSWCCFSKTERITKLRKFLPHFLIVENKLRSWEASRVTIGEATVTVFIIYFQFFIISKYVVLMFTWPVSWTIGVIGCTQSFNEQSAIGKCAKTAWKNASIDEHVQQKNMEICSKWELICPEWDLVTFAVTFSLLGLFMHKTNHFLHQVV